MEMSGQQLMTVNTIDDNETIQLSAASVGVCLCFGGEFPQ